MDEKVLAELDRLEREKRWGDGLHALLRDHLRELIDAAKAVEYHKAEVTVSRESYSRMCEVMDQARSDSMVESNNLRALLRRVEWQFELNGIYYCYFCGDAEAGGHAPDCELAEALK